MDDVQIKRLPLVLAIALSGLALAACDGSNGDRSTPSPVEQGDTATPVSETISVSSKDNAFDTDEIVVASGAYARIDFTNEEAPPHNISVYESPAAETEIFVGDIVIGPHETVTYEFVAPDEPGTYFFRCDVHPVAMTGNFIVR